MTERVSKQSHTWRRKSEGLSRKEDGKKRIWSWVNDSPVTGVNINDSYKSVFMVPTSVSCPNGKCSDQSPQTTISLSLFLCALLFSMGTAIETAQALCAGAAFNCYYISFGKTDFCFSSFVLCEWVPPHGAETTSVRWQEKGDDGKRKSKTWEND